MNAFLSARQQFSDSLEPYLENALASKTSNQHIDTSRLHEAMAYSLLDGGKRLRAMLVVSTYEALTHKTATDACFQLATAVECIHAYSLIHDDLPAMDDDNLRRGKPTNHIAFDEATAILAGDALQTLAFELICDADLTGEQIKQCVKQLASASGAAGMVGGQQFDLMSENKSLSLNQLKALHEHKTGALIRASVKLGAICANASTETQQQLDQYAAKIGLAFQVVDDILDIEADTQTLGKPQGADVALNKATYPAIMGMQEAKRYSQTLVNEAKDAISEITKNNQKLQQIADFVLSRQN